jgi:AcrR family transcriptional regulator
MAADQTRDRHLDAAERLLQRLGYQKTTMEGLAREAGLGKRTIYLHFAGKEEVMLSTIDRIVERLLDSLREGANSGGPAAERLRRMIRLGVMFRFDSVRDYYQGSRAGRAGVGRSPRGVFRPDPGHQRPAALGAQHARAGRAGGGRGPCPQDRGSAHRRPAPSGAGPCESRMSAAPARTTGHGRPRLRPPRRSARLVSNMA